MVNTDFISSKQDYQSVVKIKFIFSFCVHSNQQPNVIHPDGRNLQFKILINSRKLSWQIVFFSCLNIHRIYHNIPKLLSRIYVLANHEHFHVHDLLSKV